jgi:hypothetical protein
VAVPVPQVDRSTQLGRLAQLGQLAEQVRPAALAREQTLPVLPPLEALLPGRALQRGTCVAVGGEAATTLALALVAGPSGAGSWVAAVGLPGLGLVAAGELGVALERLVLVREPPSASWGAVVAALVDAFDVVLLPAGARGRRGDGRRVLARVRERGAVVVQVAGGPAGGAGGGGAAGSLGARRGGAAGSLDGQGAEVRLVGRQVRWSGLGQGWGHLGARQVVVEASGRRAAGRARRVTLVVEPWGQVDAVAEVVGVSAERAAFGSTPL